MPDSSNRILAGLTSRWTTFRRCAKSRAFAISSSQARIESTASAVDCPSDDSILPRKHPPDRYCITTNGTLLCIPTSRILTICGCCSCTSRRLSRLKRSRKPTSSSLYFFGTLTTTSVSSRRSNARYTNAMLPVPTRATILNRSSASEAPIINSGSRSPAPILEVLRKNSYQVGEFGTLAYTKRRHNVFSIRRLIDLQHRTI